MPGTWAATSSQGTIYVDAFAAFAHANRAGFEVLVLSGDMATTAQSFAAAAGTSFTGVVAVFRHTNDLLVAGDFSATIDWGDGTTSPGSVAGGQGSFTVLTGSMPQARLGDQLICSVPDVIVTGQFNVLVGDAGAGAGGGGLGGMGSALTGAVMSGASPPSPPSSPAPPEP